MTISKVVVSRGPLGMTRVGKNVIYCSFRMHCVVFHYAHACFRAFMRLFFLIPGRRFVWVVLKVFACIPIVDVIG